MWRTILRIMLVLKLGRSRAISFTTTTRPVAFVVPTGTSRRGGSTQPTLDLHIAAISSLDDASAAAKSRRPFRMPKDSPDDSIKTISSTGQKVIASPSLSTASPWQQLGLLTELCDALGESFPTIEQPTPVQELVIPTLLRQDVPNLAFLAATGSGKTLAYCLPLLQQVKAFEVLGSNHETATTRKPKRPKLLILAPTRELVTQITQVVKQLCHQVKLSSTSLVGGQDYGVQRRQLDKPLDILVSTPGRLLQHRNDGHVHLGSVNYVVLDEMDTLLEQGFGRELQDLLYPMLYRQQADEIVDVTKYNATTAPRVILTSATLTQAVQKIVGDTSALVNAKRHHRRAPNNATDTKTLSAATAATVSMVLPPCQVIKAPGLHKAVPRLQQTFVDVGGVDKMSLLVDVMSSRRDQTSARKLTMVFCNTAQSCRAVQFGLAEANIDTLAYHGDLHSVARQENLQQFRQGNGGDSGGGPTILVCTDLAARGLDIPAVDHVVMFDFPLNALDYLHRSGRTARGNNTGGRVTALVSRRDQVLANAIERAVRQGQPLDGLSSRKSDYQPGERLDQQGNGKPSPTGRLQAPSKYFGIKSPKGKKASSGKTSRGAGSGRQRRR